MRIPISGDLWGFQPSGDMRLHHGLFLVVPAVKYFGAYFPPIHGNYAREIVQGFQGYPVRVCFDKRKYQDSFEKFSYHVANSTVVDHRKSRKPRTLRSQYTLPKLYKDSRTGILGIVV